MHGRHKCIFAAQVFQHLNLIEGRGFHRTRTRRDYKDRPFKNARRSGKTEATSSILLLAVVIYGYLREMHFLEKVTTRKHSWSIMHRFGWFVQEGKGGGSERESVNSSPSTYTTTRFNIRKLHPKFVTSFIELLDFNCSAILSTCVKLFISRRE